jgi:hypothetical protein
MSDGGRFKVQRDGDHLIFVGIGEPLVLGAESERRFDCESFDLELEPFPDPDAIVLRVGWQEFQGHRVS